MQLIDVFTDQTDISRYRSLSEWNTNIKAISLVDRIVSQVYFTYSTLYVHLIQSSSSSCFSIYVCFGVSFFSKSQSFFWDHPGFSYHQGDTSKVWWWYWQGRVQKVRQQRRIDGPDDSPFLAMLHLLWQMSLQIALLCKPTTPVLGLLLGASTGWPLGGHGQTVNLVRSAVGIYHSVPWSLIGFAREGS